MKAQLLSLVAGLVFVAVCGAVLFGCAGRWDLPMYWAYLGVWGASAAIAGFVVEPSLIKERLRPGPGGKDYLTLFIAAPVWLVQHVVAGLDVGRFHWSDSVPWALQVLGLVATTAAMGVMFWAISVNRFFSSVIRIQTDRGHQLVTSGPYRFVRHPAYAASPLLVVGCGLALGSWLAALIGLLAIAPILRRTAQEDRILREHLEGYAAYAERVRYRLFPGVW